MLDFDLDAYLAERNARITAMTDEWWAAMKALEGTLRLPSTTADTLTDGHTRYHRDEQDPSRWWVCDSDGRRFASIRLGALLDTADFHGLTVRAG